MSDEPQAPFEAPAPELEREQRRLERLRLVTQQWPLADRDDESDPGPQQAA
jgi:hypothetical protein